MFSIIIIKLLLIFSFCVPSSFPTRSQSSDDSEWRGFLVELHDEPSYTSLNLDHHHDEQRGGDDKQGSINSPQTPTGDIIRKYTKDAVRSDSLTAKRAERYRKKMKEQTGFSSIRNARINELRKLEGSGQITIEQEDELRKQRETKKIYQRKYQRQKELANPFVVKRKRGRPPSLHKKSNDRVKYRKGKFNQDE